MACQWQGDGTQASWDGLRRDHELWVPDGDCLVYLYDEGQSQRGASMCIPYSLLEDAKCSSLTAFCLSESDGPIPTKKLFLGAPEDLSRKEAFNWHITTRNFFAWLLRKPLVGEHLSRAMIDLLSRMAIYRDSSIDNVGDVFDYADAIGYSDISCRPELALAMLAFADEYKLTDTWIDAFAHCVGMRENLPQCHEYEVTRNVNKALITRAALQMDLHLERATHAVDTLLEQDLALSQAGLSAGSRRHLEHFRSFLQSHFVASYGYWPVRQEKFAKDLYESMRAEFETLYDYLADKNLAGGDSHSEQLSPDGISVQQNITAFDSRHALTPLPHAMPLLPNINNGAGYRTQAHWALRNWRLGLKDHKHSAVEIVRSAYVDAANHQDTEILNSPLVQAFTQFEAELSNSFDDELSFIDSRKTRWIMVYQLLQTLKSITDAPVEVRDTYSAPYPLCCPVAGVPTWKFSSRASWTTGVDGSPASHSPINSSQEMRQEPLAGRPNSMAYYSSSSKHVLTNGAVGTESNSPLGHKLPEKSHRRSLLISKNHSDMDDLWVAPQIPTRHSSHGPRPTLKQTNSRGSSETIPSLNWSRGSTKSISSSDGPASPMSGSSSVYSVESQPEEKSKSVEPFVKDFFSEDGGFVCPGISF